MSWADEYLARQQGQQQAAQAGSAKSGFLGGFISSGLSSVGEMFGMDPFPSATEFRDEHPYAGIASELVGGIVPYAGWEGVIAKAPAIAEGLDAITAATKIDRFANPIKFGAANLAIRYAPVELARLGTGLITTDDWQKYQGLMADVGLSTLLTGGIGALGGFIHSGGTIEKTLSGRLADAPIGWAAPFQLRLADSPTAEVIGNASLDQVKQDLVRETFLERPLQGGAGSTPRRALAVGGLDGVEEPKAAVQLSTLFNPSRAKTPTGLVRSTLMKPDGTWTLGDDGNTELLGALGLPDMETLAASGRFPTIVDVGSDSAAGTMRRAVEGLSPVADGVLMGREAGDGLFIVGKRIKAGVDLRATPEAPLSTETELRPHAQSMLDDMSNDYELAKSDSNRQAEADQLFQDIQDLRNDPANYQPVAAPKSDSPLPKALAQQSNINPGDRWLFVKTDQPQRFAPQTSKSADLTFNQFAKFRDPFNPASAAPDYFNQRQNLMLQAMSPADYRDVLSGKMNKTTFQAKIGQNLTKTAGEFSGLGGSELVNRLADQLYDVVVPTMFKETRNPLFGRLFSMLRLNNTEAESFVNRMLGGAVKVKGRPFGGNVTHVPEFAPGVGTFTSLVDQFKPTPEDIQTVFHVGMSQAPAEELAQLTKDGMLSPAAQGILDGISKLDKSFWENMLPVAKNLGLDTKFSLLEGPYVPRLYKGDTFLRVEDPSGTLKFLANGKTFAEAQHQAKTFIDEAAKIGVELKQGRMFGLHSDEISGLHQQFEASLFNDPKIPEIAKATAKRLAMENAGIRPGMIRAPMSSSLKNARTGLAGSPDRAPYTVKDLADAMRQHYSQIAKNLGYESWRQRWLPEAFRLKGDSRFYFGAADAQKMLFEDLNRRARMMLGYEGPTAKYLNSGLSKVFGPALGGKAATKIALGTNKLLYAWNIGIFNPTFALVNLLTPLQTVAPWIAMMKQAPENAERLMHVHLRYGPDGKPAGVFNTLSTAKVLGQSLREMGNPDATLMEHFGRAKTDGSLSPQLYEYAIGQNGVAAQGIRGAYQSAGGGIGGAWKAMEAGATFMSRHTEEWSRLYAFTAGHIVGRDLFGLSGEALYRFAQRATHVTMYGYHAMDRSLMFTGPIGSMFGLFKNWQMHFIGQMMEYAGLGWREGMWAPLAWQFAGSLAIGGIGATPLVLAADQLSKWFSNQPTSFMWMKEHFPHAADELYYGFPAMFGVSLQASATLPGTDVRNDVSTLANFVFLERAKAAWTATAAAWQYAEANGQNPLKDPNIRDALMQAYAPRAFFRAFSATEGGVVKSMSTGYPQVRGVSPISQLAYVAGLNPLQIEEERTVANQLWKDQTARQAAVTAAGERFAQAELAGDSEEMDAVVQRSIAQGLPMTSIAKAAQTRMRRETTSDLLSKYSKDQQAVYRQALGQ